MLAAANSAHARDAHGDARHDWAAQLFVWPISLPSEEGACACTGENLRNTRHEKKGGVQVKSNQRKTSALKTREADAGRAREAA